MFNPVKVLEKIPAPPAVIIELTVLGQSATSTEQPVSIQLAGKKSIDLKPGQNSFELSFTTGNFAIAKEVEYSYMLKGFDDRWIMARNGNVATFRDLPAGTYTFMVRTRLRNQDWGEPSEVEIVLPPLSGSLGGRMPYMYVSFCPLSGFSSISTGNACMRRRSSVTRRSVIKEKRSLTTNGCVSIPT